MKISGCILGILALMPFAASAARVTYTSKDAKIFRHEQIYSVLVNKEPESSVYIVSEGLYCRIYTKTMAEAFAIQAKLSDDPRSWLQCFGDYRTYENPTRIVVETDRYSLGKKLVED